MVVIGAVTDSLSKADRRHRRSTWTDAAFSGIGHLEVDVDRI